MFKGIYTALITPFTSDGKVDYVALLRLLQFQEDSSVDGIVILGTTAESSSLTKEETENIIQLARLMFSKTLIVGVCGNCTSTVIQTVQRYSQFNIDGFLVGSPYYNRPSQMGIYNHYLAIAKSTNLPICLYNVPSRAAVSINVDTVCKLAKIKNIVAIKDASGNCDYFTNLLSKVPSSFSVLCGNDNCLLPMLSVGAKGCISVVSNILPELPCKIYACCESLQFKTAAKVANIYNEFINDLFIESNPVPIKYVMSEMSLCCSNVRFPLTELSKSSKKVLAMHINNIFMK